MKKRLDILLVEKNLYTSRQQAQRCIRAGEVKINQRIIDKPGTEINIKAEIEVKIKPPYVSRRGKKLEKALNTFQLSVVDRICLDGGISTGGFSDCLLQSGARLVYGIDVGYGQVAWSLRQNKRIFLKERTNIRYLTPDILYEKNIQANLGVVDVSFISLTKILEPLSRLLTSPKEVILLVKPQFEVGKSKIGKNGVVRDLKDHCEAICKIIEVSYGLGWLYCGLTHSPIKGPAGNTEYLLWLRSDYGSQNYFSNQVEAICSQYL